MREIQSKIALAIVVLCPDELQLKIDNMLNRWEVHWLLCIPFFNYRFLTIKNKIKITDLVMNYVKFKFSEKEVLRYHNVRSKSKGNMTDEQFNFWYKCLKNNELYLYWNKYTS